MFQEGNSPAAGPIYPCPGCGKLKKGKVSEQRREAWSCFLFRCGPKLYRSRSWEGAKRAVYNKFLNEAKELEQHRKSTKVPRRVNKDVLVSYLRTKETDSDFQKFFTYHPHLCQVSKDFKFQPRPNPAAIAGNSDIFPFSLDVESSARAESPGMSPTLQPQGAQPSASEGKSLLRQDIRQDQSDTPPLQQLDDDWLENLFSQPSTAPMADIAASSPGPQRKRRRTVDAFVEKLKDAFRQGVGDQIVGLAAEDGKSRGVIDVVWDDQERKIKKLTVNHLTIQSDPNIKANMRVLETLRVGEDNIKVYAYTFKNDPQKIPRIGFNAAEIQRVYPELVNASPSGVRSVDYIGMSAVAWSRLQKLERRVDRIQVRTGIVEAKQAMHEARIVVGEAKQAMHEARIGAGEARTDRIEERTDRVEARQVMHEQEIKAQLKNFRRSLPQRIPSRTWNLQPRNPDFTGRDALIQRIEDKLRASEGDSTTKVVLAGMGGVGKTQTAREYAYRNRNKYNVVWWLQADSIDDSMCELALELKLLDAKQIAGKGFDAKKVASTVRVHLRGSPGWLLVIDNCQKRSAIKGYLPETGGHAIVTTRNSTWPGAVRVDRLAGDDSMVLLKKSSGKDQLDGKELKAARDIVTRLGGLPLALSQAGAYVKQDPAMTFAKYLAFFDKARRELWYGDDDDSEDDSDGEGEDHGQGQQSKHTVATTLLVSLRDMKKNSAASAVLEMASFVAPKEIPVTLFTELLRGDGGGDRKVPAVGPPASPEALEIKVKKAVRKLMRYSLLERGQAQDTYAIHRLLQAVVRDKVEDEKRSQEVSDRAVGALINVFKGTSQYSVERKRVNTHIMEAAPRFKRFSGRNKELWGLLLDSASTFLDAGTYSLAERMLDLASKSGEKVKKFSDGKESKDIQLLYARNYHFRGRLQEKTGHYEKALEMYNKDLEIKLPILGENHQEVATTYNYMGWVYILQGQYDKALDMSNKALKIRLAALGEGHPDVAITYNQIGVVYDNQGQYDKALEVHKTCLKIRLAALGEVHPDVAITYNNMGSVYRSQGQYDKALEMFNKCLQIWLTTLGEDHPDVATAYAWMGEVYKSQGQYDKALEVHKTCLKIRLAALGEDHPDVAATYGSMGNVYNSQGQYDKALEMYTKCLKIRLAALCEDHPDVATTYNCMGSVYNSQGQYDKALEMYNKCLKIRLTTLGEDHPHVATTYNNIGMVYKSQGQYDKALEMYNKCLKISLAALGENHPDVAATYNQMGNVYKSQGQYDKALEMHNKSLKIKLAALGEDHPEVATTYNNMGNVYFSQGQYDKALEMYNKCLNILLDTLGEGHPHTTIVRKSIKIVEGKLKAA